MSAETETYARTLATEMLNGSTEWWKRHGDGYVSPAGYGPAEASAMAVAAQVLRDVVDLFDTRVDNAESLDDEFTADLHACFTIIAFARERGIDLGEQP